jgi:DNA replication and repair protein RecF
VEQGYRQVWQRYARSLRQRNAALRATVPASQVTVWDRELVDAGLALDRMRRNYLQELEPLITQEVGLLLESREFGLRYHSGWSRDLSLQDALVRSLESDRARGYTHAGPHRADCSLWLNGKPVASHYSRGQQKAVILAFIMGQVKLQHQRQRSCGAFLLDDIASELDASHQARILTALADLDVQVFVTAIDAVSLDVSAWSQQKRFHVEQGEIRELL